MNDGKEGISKSDLNLNKRVKNSPSVFVNSQTNMSELAEKDKKKAADRRQAAMRMNYTKVKPTVVKHVLPNEVMHIRDPQVCKNAL